MSSPSASSSRDRSATRRSIQKKRPCSRSDAIRSRSLPPSPSTISLIGKARLEPPEDGLDGNVSELLGRIGPKSSDTPMERHPIYPSPVPDLEESTECSSQRPPSSAAAPWGARSPRRSPLPTSPSSSRTSI